MVTGDRSIFVIIHYPTDMVFAMPGADTLSPEHQSAQMSKITNDSLTQSGTGCSIAVTT